MPENQPPRVRPTDTVPSVQDREIDTLENDAFGHRHYADALRGLVEDSQLVAPYSIGLLGGWGTGKSSVKALYLKDISSRPGSSIKPITFNAWRFGGEDIRRALLRDVFVDLGGDEAAIYDHFFAQTTQKQSIPKKFKELLQEGYERFFFYLAQMLFLLVVAVFGTKFAASALGVSDDQTFVWILATFAAFFAYAPKMLERMPLNRYTDVTKIDLPKTTAEQYEKLLVEQIRRFKNSHPTIKRLAVFVDDLDRLSSEEMVSGLDAIRTLMELPESRTGLGIVFIISCDEDLVAAALARRSFMADMPGAIRDRIGARRYLDRIFQFRLELPPAPRQDMRAFAKTVFERPAFSQIVAKIVESGSTIDEVISRLIHVGVSNPRNCKQLLNAYAESMWIAMKREFEGKASQKAGALVEGAVTQHPISLAVITVIRVEFPEFFAALRKEPACLDGFLSIYVRKEDQSTLSHNVRSELSAFGDYSDDQKIWTIRHGHEQLREYLSSIIAVQFPSSLQPLLILNQDEVARRTGDAGARLYAPVISGDLTGTLQVLGRDTDDLPLTYQQVEALANVWDLVSNDSSDRQENAASILARLATRCSEDAHARRLFIPIAKAFTDSRGLRARVGLDTIRSLLPFIKSNDRSMILDRISSDVGFSSDTDYILLSVSGKKAAMSEAVSNVSTAAEMLLEEWDRGGLTESTKSTFTNWLSDRTVSLGEKSKKILPFDFFDERMQRFERLLLPYVAEAYAEGAITELQSDKPSLIDQEATIERCQKIVRDLPKQSEEYWLLLNRFTNTAYEEANIAAQTLIAESLELGTKKQIDTLAGVLADRIEKPSGESELYADDKEAIEILSDLCRKRPTDLIEALPKIASTCIKLGQADKSAIQSVRLASALYSISSESAVTVFEEWIGRLSDGLHPECAKCLGTYLNSIEDEDLQQKLSEELTSLIQSDDPDSNRTLQEVWKAASDANILAEPTVATLLQESFAELPQRAGRLSASKQLWPIFDLGIAHLEQSQVGVALQSSLETASFNAVTYAGFLEFMERRWESTKSLSSFNHMDCILKATSLLGSNTDKEAAKAILHSLNALGKYAELADDQKDKLILATITQLPLAPDEAERTLTSLADRIWIEELEKMYSIWEVQPNELEGRIQNILIASNENLDDEDLSNLTERLSQTPIITTRSSTDAGIKAFVDSLPDSSRTSLLAYVESSDLPEQSKQRLLKQLAKHAGTLSDKDASTLFLLTAQLLPQENVEQAVHSYSAAKKGASNFAVCERLAQQLIDAKSFDTKRALAQVIYLLDGRVVVENQLRAMVFSSDDLQILLDAFPSSRKIKNAIKRLPK